MPETTETVVCALGLLAGLAGIIAGTIVLKSRRPDSVPGCRGPCESSGVGRRGTVERSGQRYGWGCVTARGPAAQARRSQHRGAGFGEEKRPVPARRWPGAAGSGAPACLPCWAGVRAAVKGSQVLLVSGVSQGFLVGDGSTLVLGVVRHVETHTTLMCTVNISRKQKLLLPIMHSSWHTVGPQHMSL